jgi:class 3 adenylate cyclase
MVTGAISSEHYLVEEDYGDGTELSTTGFFIFGILTFWIYTVWKFHGLLIAHIKSRLKALCKSLDVPNLSPAIAIYHIYEVIAEGGDVVLTIQVWSAVIFALAAVFHLWGTQLLIDMYNGHLRIEAVNQQHLRGENPWVTQGARSILGDYQKKEDHEKPGDLVPLRTLAAIMLTDIVGFSKDMEKDETLTYAKLMNHNKTIRTVISQHRGEEIKTIGDAFLVRFKSAVDAVRAGVAIQRGFRGYNAQRPEEERILVRIGIHIGDILIMDRDVLGNGVNIAARIEPLAEPGGICISADVYNVVKNVISLNVLNIGRKELKNIADAPEIFRVFIDKEA